MMPKPVRYNEYLPQAMQQLPAGAFLTVQAGEELNTMTIGWGTVGYIWRKPIFTVAVRTSRYTYELMRKTQEFTVSFPLDIDMKEELKICGTKSAREIDKFAVCSLIAQPGQVVATPVIGQCDLHYECRIIYTQTMEPNLLDGGIDHSCYQDRVYHTLYYGEIVACYLNK